MLVNSALRILVEMPVEEIRAFLDRITVQANQGESDLAKWSRIITDRK